MRLLSTRPYPWLFYQTTQESQMSLAMRHLIVQQSEEQAATDVTKSRQSLDVVSDTSSEESLK